MPSRLRQPRKLKAPRLYTHARKSYRESAPRTPDVVTVPGLNQWESRVYFALLELKIRFTVQSAFGGGSILGGGRADFLLPDYGVDLEVNGPYHFTTEGRARDLLRNLVVQKDGYVVKTIEGRDFERLKPRILELLGSPFAGLGGSA